MIYRTNRHEWELSHRVLLMGIVNVTPDSFSEKVKMVDPESAIAHGLQLAEDGADILDVGGESTRPGAEMVGCEEELARVVPVIEGLRSRCNVAISVDTYKAEVAAAALAAGADIVNDISGLRRDADMAQVIAGSGAGCVLMHMRGMPQTMQQFTKYESLIGDMNRYFQETLRIATDAGVDRACISLDPGVGFSKTSDQNLEIIRLLADFARWECPLLLGTSRKSFIGNVLSISDPSKRIWGTAASVTCGIVNGARLIRVHDVKQMRQVVDMTMAILWA